MEHSSLTGGIIAAALRVHSALGPGLLESAYEACLEHELKKSGYHVRRQVPVPIVYDGINLDAGYRIDLLVDDTVIIELKAVDQLAPIHQAQLISYLRLASKRVGLIINFHTVKLTDGIVRRIV